MILNEIYNQDLITPPYWLPSNTHYIVCMGSQAYGVETKDSDFDLYGWAFPPKEYINPHKNGYIIGYDEIPKFEQWSQHGIVFNKKGYDFTIYSIVKYVKLLSDNNPNIIDSLFVPKSCVLHCTKIAQILRDNRKTFLHKGLYNKFRGYAYSMLHKLQSKKPVGKRKDMIEKFGIDVKFQYHLYRLALETEQLLIEGDLDLQEAGRKDLMKACRNGEVSLEDTIKWFSIKEKQLEHLFEKSFLPQQPNHDKIKSILVHCLEAHYGKIENLINNTPLEALKEIKIILNKYQL